MIFKYRRPDESKRDVQENIGERTVKGPEWLYNQNLTVGELSLLRRLIWDYEKWKKTAHFPEDVTAFLHTWLFTDEKKLVLCGDIAREFEEGVQLEVKGQ